MKVLRNKGVDQDWTSWFEHYYNTNFERFFRYAYSITESKPLAEDVVSEVFLIIWKKKQDLKNLCDLNPYIYASVRNLAIKTKSQQSKKQRIGVDQEIMNVHDPESILLGRELESVIQEVFDRLTPHGKLIYDMARNKGMSYENIAEELGISKHTVQKHLSNVLKEFRVHLLKRFPVSEPGHLYLSKYISSILILIHFF